jgi:hypothetical protein
MVGAQIEILLYATINPMIGEQLLAGMRPIAQRASQYLAEFNIRHTSLMSSEKQRPAEAATVYLLNSYENQLK